LSIWGLSIWRSDAGQEKLPNGWTDGEVASVRHSFEARQLTPHRIQTFKFTERPEVAAKLNDIDGPYIDHPAHAVILSVDNAFSPLSCEGRKS
jgi:hypothetical protein